MALSRIRCSKDLPVVLNRLNQGVNVSTLKKGPKQLDPRYIDSGSFHLSSVRKYPEAPRLPLPGNVCEIFSNETGRFTPERVRDITTPVLLYATNNNQKTWSTSWMSNPTRTFGDSHVDSYDCFGAISLNSTMQTNVPKPFNSTGRATHMNMPGGQWVQNGKYIAEYMQNSHYSSIRKSIMKRKFCGNVICHPGTIGKAWYSTNTDDKNVGGIDKKEINEKPLTRAEKLKRAVKDYGSTVIVFHVSISLISLGAFYALVSSGLDLTSIVKLIPNSSERMETIMTGSSTFLVAYAVHKVFAPVRISITLGATPFIVGYLRRIGILKSPKT